ncbi:unnamed protein product [Cyprideis torosa]|uniref:Uncharacterized protein n=1 Tax=Cyprideis torosa TaxID=163714 RepID=A0A7R8WJ31_9CRUS|nr:unnamed protein product [Cyprideis torosa]CAG0899571.1 unnamed protein product [Cyprideis torosa]
MCIRADVGTSTPTLEDRDCDESLSTKYVICEVDSIPTYAAGCLSGIAPYVCDATYAYSASGPPYQKGTTVTITCTGGTLTAECLGEPYGWYIFGSLNLYTACQGCKLRPGAFPEKTRAAGVEAFCKLYPGEIDGEAVEGVLKRLRRHLAVVEKKEKKQVDLGARALLEFIVFWGLVEAVRSPNHIHRAYNHRADNHRADNHRADNHRADNHRADNHRADNQADNYEADNCGANNHETDNHNGEFPR